MSTTTRVIGDEAQGLLCGRGDMWRLALCVHLSATGFLYCERGVGGVPVVLYMGEARDGTIGVAVPKTNRSEKQEGEAAGAHRVAESSDTDRVPPFPRLRTVSSFPEHPSNPTHLVCGPSSRLPPPLHQLSLQIHPLPVVVNPPLPCQSNRRCPTCSRSRQTRPS